MAEKKLVAALGDFDEMWGAALREKGFQCFSTKNIDEVSQSNADFVLIDLRNDKAKASLRSLGSSLKASILPMIEEGTSRNELVELRKLGVAGYVNRKTPAQDIALRLQSMSRASGAQESKAGEARSARRVWFQQQVKFTIFNETHESWSTTLSETGIFIRTSLSFPLYSIMKMDFQLWGDEAPFVTDGVIVRQEVDSDIRGLGVMFQNLKGESVRRLESFFDIYKP
jgi:hypothetical protein